MIRLRNLKEDNLVGTGAAPVAVTADAVVLGRYNVPEDGEILGATASVAVAAGAGGTAHKQGIKIYDAGFPGTGTTLISAISNLAKDDTVLNPAGTILIARGIQGTKVAKGTQVQVVGYEAGTPAGADVTVNILNVLYRSDKSLDPIGV